MLTLKQLQPSAKIFITSILCLLGIDYALLLGGIWQDTQMDITLIKEGYSSFETVEIIEHTFKYLFWFIGVFGITLGIFLLSSYPEKMKKIFAFIIPLGIVSDIGSMWLVKYCGWFAWQMYGSGLILFVCFLSMFILIQRELWEPTR